MTIADLRSMRHDDAFASQNRAAAEVILEDVQRYGGPGSALVRWAAAVVERQDGAEAFQLTPPRGRGTSRPAWHRDRAVGKIFAGASFEVSGKIIES